MWSGYYKKNIQNASYVEFRQVQKKEEKNSSKFPQCQKQQIQILGGGESISDMVNTGTK